MSSDSSKSPIHSDSEVVLKKHAIPVQKKYGPISAIAVTLGSYFGAYLVFFMVAGGGLALWAAVKGGTIEKLSESVESSTAGQFLTSLLVYSAMAGLVYLFIKSRKVLFKEVGLGRKPVISDAGWAILTFIGYFIVFAVTMGLVSSLIPSVNLEQEQQLDFEKGTQGPALILIFIALAVIPPLVEEFVMRGFLYSGLRRSLKILPAALVTSFIFCIAHLQLGAGAPPLYVAAIDTFVLSMFLVYLREKTGSIWSGILVHALKNGLAFSALFLFAS